MDSRSPDLDLVEILRHFDVRPGALLGSGGEAEVLALGTDRVLRVHREGTHRRGVEWRSALMTELGASRERVPFALPEVLEFARVARRWITIERRLPGRPMGDVLRESRGSGREHLIRGYLEAAASIGDIEIARSAFGDIGPNRRICTRTFGAYLEQRAEYNLKVAGSAFGSIDAARITERWPEPQELSLVHLDVFPGNVLTDGNEILAVIDFGPIALVGDRRLDPLTAAVYLETAFSPHGRASDHVVARLD
jgi:hypothetical protein